MCAHRCWIRLRLGRSLPTACVRVANGELASLNLTPVPCRAVLGCVVLCRAMAGCARAVAPALLIQANLLLCVIAGAGLATAARLKWDPSTYIAVRALFPREYRAAAAVLCAACAALLALAHLAAAALAARAAAPRLARALLILYGVAMCALVCGEVCWGAWTGARLAAWLRSEEAAQVLDLLELRDYLRPFLGYLSRYHPLPDRLKSLVEEAEADAPRNLYAAAAAALLTALLQPVAALLALVCAADAARVPRRPLPATNADSISFSYTSTDNEKAPLKTAYRNGRLVVV